MRIDRLQIGKAITQPHKTEPYEAKTMVGTKQICLPPAIVNPNASSFLCRAAPLTTYHSVQHEDKMVNSIE